MRFCSTMTCLEQISTSSPDPERAAAAITVIQPPQPQQCARTTCAKECCPRSCPGAQRSSYHVAHTDCFDHTGQQLASKSTRQSPKALPIAASSTSPGAPDCRQATKTQRPLCVPPLLRQAAAAACFQQSKSQVVGYPPTSAAAISCIANLPPSFTAITSSSTDARRNLRDFTAKLSTWPPERL